MPPIGMMYSNLAAQAPIKTGKCAVKNAVNAIPLDGMSFA
jgi:hypothetical protein